MTTLSTSGIFVTVNRLAFILYPVVIAKEDQHLSSDTFKAGIYHLIEDLTRVSTGVPTG
jgi:hypothetical protein